MIIFLFFGASTSHVLLVESALLLLQHASTPNFLMTRNRSISCAAWPLLHSTPWLPAVLLDLGLRATWRTWEAVLNCGDTQRMEWGIQQGTTFFRHQNDHERLMWVNHPIAKG